MIRRAARIAHRMAQRLKRLSLGIKQKDREFICCGPSHFPSIFYGEGPRRPRTVSGQLHYNLFVCSEYHACEQQPAAEYRTDELIHVRLLSMMGCSWSMVYRGPAASPVFYRSRY